MGSLYVVSDVHGFRDDLVRALDRVDFGGDDQLWILGDLLDRGPDGIGVIEHVRSLQGEAPDQVHVLMGNHEALALGRKRFPRSRFGDSWLINGGRERDQDGLTDEHVAWLASLPLMALADDLLLMHSDTTQYLTWGSTIEEVNTTVASALRDSTDLDAHWDLWAKLTRRYDFVGPEGSDAAQRMLSTYGGAAIVHGHSIIGTLTGKPSAVTQRPLLYADGHVLDIDGGRYDGGPLLLVRLR